MDLPEMTPALYGIVVGIDYPIIRNEFKLFIVTVLNNEEKLIYPAAFSAFRQKISFGLNKPKIFRIFFELVEDKLDGAHHREILKAVFDVYWMIAEKKQYWQNGRFESGAPIEYKVTLEKWKDENQTGIRWREEELKACLSKK